MDIYRQQILDHYKNPKNFGKLEDPDASFEAGNTLCGDKIGIAVKLKKLDTKYLILNTVMFWGEGCAISMASASMLTQKVKDMKIEEIKKLKYEDIKNLLGIDLSPARIKCAMLSLEVLLKTISLLN